MNRLPTKQIYLLFIIIVGIIALSVYSTYALFTFENSTSDIVSIHIPKSLTISENIYEYQQVVVKPNTIATTDIDIYNAFDYEVCYSIWYKVVGTPDIQNNVQVFEKNEDTLTTSGLLSATTNIRSTLVIVNDNDSEIKINLGTIGTQKIDGSCSLNISSDKSVVSTSYKNLDVLTTKLLEDTTTITKEENYMVYKDQTEKILYKDTDKVYTSNEFTYSNEIFTLTNGEHLTIKDLVDKNNLQENDIYICEEDTTCRIMYKIEINNIEVDNIGTTYSVSKYDKFIGHSEGANGLRKINATDYVYYGDNPNNFIYYNCENNDDLTSCELWRIVGFFYNEKTGDYNTKIVRNNIIGKYQFDYKMVNNKNQSSNIWETSTLYKYLNEEYKLIGNNDIYIEEYIDQVERIPNLEVNVNDIKVSNETMNKKISLLNLSDYLYASICNNNKLSEYNGNCLTNNWLNNIEINKEWTLTAKEVEIITETNENVLENQDEITNESDNNDNLIEDTENTIDESQENDIVENQESTETVDENNYVINYVYAIGDNISEQDVNDTLDIRPVVFLKSRMLLLDGNGTLEMPYVVK